MSKIQLQLLLRITGCVSVIFFGLGHLSAQTNQDSHDIRIIVPKTATIAIAGNNEASIQLAAQAPVDAGKGLDFSAAVDNSLWLNYSAVSQEGKSIYVKIVEGTMPEGAQIQVNASTAVGDGQGNLGQVDGSITLSETNQELISGITTCYTGEGQSKGRQLQYSLVSSSNYANTYATTNQVVTVCYTITD